MSRNKKKTLKKYCKILQRISSKAVCFGFSITRSHTQVDAKYETSKEKNNRPGEWPSPAESPENLEKIKAFEPQSFPNSGSAMIMHKKHMICLDLSSHSHSSHDAEMMEKAKRGIARYRKHPHFHQGLHRRQHLGTAFLPGEGCGRRFSA